MTEYFYGDDEEQLLKDYARLYLFGGYVLLGIVLVVIALLVGFALWIKSLLF